MRFPPRRLVGHSLGKKKKIERRRHLKGIDDSAGAEGLRRQPVKAGEDQKKERGSHLEDQGKKKGAATPPILTAVFVELAECTRKKNRYRPESEDLRKTKDRGVRETTPPPQERKGKKAADLRQIDVIGPPALGRDSS